MVLSKDINTTGETEGKVYKIIKIPRCGRRNSSFTVPKEWKRTTIEGITFVCLKQSSSEHSDVMNERVFEAND